MTVWSKSRTRRLISLRKKKIVNAEIAKRLGVSIFQLEGEVQRLIASGEIRSRRGVLASHDDAYQSGKERSSKLVAMKVKRLYLRRKSHREIATALDLTPTQVRNVLGKLFEDGMPRRPRGATDEEVRTIHEAYLAGGSIDKLAEARGFSGNGIRVRMAKLGLPVGSKARKRSA